MRWVTESARPFEIVNDRAWKNLMKTGRPEYYTPSSSQVSKDLKQVFKNCRKRISKMLQDYDGALNFATDCWTSPNHGAYMAITVHFLYRDEPLALLLDIIEVPRSHTGKALAEEFSQVLVEMELSKKVISVHTGKLRID